MHNLRNSVIFAPVRKLYIDNIRCSVYILNMIYGTTQTKEKYHSIIWIFNSHKVGYQARIFARKEGYMYKNLLYVMKIKGITSIQLSNLLQCRQATVSEKLNGVVASGFSFDEAAKIKKEYFNEYEYDFLFHRIIN